MLRRRRRGVERNGEEEGKGRRKERRGGRKGEEEGKEERMERRRSKGSREWAIFILFTW
jgi:hypothetical protein